MTVGDHDEDERLNRQDGIGFTQTAYGMTFVSRQQFSHPISDALCAAIEAGQAVYASPHGARSTSPYHAVVAAQGRHATYVVRALCGKQAQEWRSPTTAIGRYAEVCERCKRAAAESGKTLAPRFEHPS